MSFVGAQVLAIGFNLAVFHSLSLLKGSLAFQPIFSH